MESPVGKLCLPYPSARSRTYDYPMLDCDIDRYFLITRYVYLFRYLHGRGGRPDGLSLETTCSDSSVHCAGNIHRLICSYLPSLPTGTSSQIALPGEPVTADLPLTKQPHLHTKRHVGREGSESRLFRLTLKGPEISWLCSQLLVEDRAKDHVIVWLAASFRR